MARERGRSYVRHQSSWERIPEARRIGSIDISVGNPFSTGEHLRLQLEWAKDKFATFEFVIGDTLNVYNYMIIGHPDFGVLDAQKAADAARNDGDEWLEQNESLIESVLSGRFEVKRWDDCLSAPNVKSHLRELVDYYGTNTRFARDVDADVGTFLARRDFTLDDPNQMVTLSRHILEELAVFRAQAESGVVVTIYAGTDHELLRSGYWLSDKKSSPLRWLNQRHFVNLGFRHAPRVGSRPAPV